jgi:sortase A
MGKRVLAYLAWLGALLLVVGCQPGGGEADTATPSADVRTGYVLPTLTPASPSVHATEPITGRVGEASIPAVPAAPSTVAPDEPSQNSEPLPETPGQSQVTGPGQPERPVLLETPVAGEATPIPPPAAPLAAASPAATTAPAAQAPVITQPTAVTRARPARLQIPRLNIDAAVESVGQTHDGLMDVPRAAQNVAWYNLGAYPGDAGNAVLSGHLDDRGGAPAVFWRLDELEPGDLVIVVDSAGRSQRFEVTRKESYPFDQAPLQEIFGFTLSRNLNLITCEGVWDRANRNYDRRLVVYTRLLEGS